MDLDDDGIKEIIQEGKECLPQFDEEEGKWKPIEPCQTTRQVYQYDGVKYSERP